MKSNLPYLIQGGELLSEPEMARPVSHPIRQRYRPLSIACSRQNLGFGTGQFGFALTEPAGQPVVVDASTDLMNWLPIWTNTFMVGPLQFSDPNSGLQPNCFYRVRKP